MAPSEIDGILIDPENPPKYDIPNDERSIRELKFWWKRPYVRTSMAPIGGYDVYCLDGGAWDRPTWVGRGDTIDEAVAIAKLRWWGRMSKQRGHPQPLLKKIQARG